MPDPSSPTPSSETLPLSESFIAAQTKLRLPWLRVDLQGSIDLEAILKGLMPLLSRQRSGSVSPSSEKPAQAVADQLASRSATLVVSGCPTGTPTWRGPDLERWQTWVNSAQQVVYLQTSHQAAPTDAARRADRQMLSPELQGWLGQTCGGFATIRTQLLQALWPIGGDREPRLPALQRAFAAQCAASAGRLLESSKVADVPLPEDLSAWLVHLREPTRRPSATPGFQPAALVDWVGWHAPERGLDCLWVYQASRPGIQERVYVHTTARSLVPDQAGGAIRQSVA